MFLTQGFTILDDMWQVCLCAATVPLIEIPCGSVNPQTVPQIANWTGYSKWYDMQITEGPKRTSQNRKGAEYEELPKIEIGSWRQTAPTMDCFKSRACICHLRFVTKTESSLPWEPLGSLSGTKQSIQKNLKYDHAIKQAAREKEESVRGGLQHWRLAVLF